MVSKTRESSVLWLSAPRQIEFLSSELGSCGDDEIYCETIVTAISPGTELAAFIGLPSLKAGPQYPRVQGYCNIARVIEVGKNVTNVTAGCRVLSFQSHRTSFLLKETEILYQLNDKQDARKVVCAYLYHLGYNAVIRSGIRAGSRVLIIGMGVLGTTSLQMCQISGATVDVITENKVTSELAKTIGVTNIYDRKEFDQRSLSANALRYDVVITTVNGWADWRRALIATKKLGMIAMLGFPGRGEPLPDFNPLEPEFVYAKQIRIESIGESPDKPDPRGFLNFNERDNLAFIIDCIDRLIIDTSDIASENFGYLDIGEAYEKLIQRATLTPTVLIDWGPQ